ncbi:MAG TPA: CoA transferase, partial [Candidatus Binataceae bacterium]|nr:CoA transferase [Candidatus Binataceae bacterium]
MSPLPLAGIRVTDFSWIINGPQTALWLAAMGAEVIKIESRVYLDYMRIGPAAMADDVSGPNRSGIFHNLNYGKKSINLNLATPKGRALAYELVKRSDFVLECFPAPHTRKLGLTYEQLKAVKADIILVSISLLGKTGLQPSDWVGWGPMAASYVGMFDAQGYPGGAPRQTGGTWPDYAIATAVVFHALAALRHRDRTGEGQWIDASMGETVIGEMPEWFMDYFMNGRDRRQVGNRDDVMAPHNTYPCKGDDKWIAIAVGSDDEWSALCGVMESPAWTKQPAYATQSGRWKNSAEIDARLSQWTRQHDHIELANRLQAAGVPAGPVLDSVEVHQDAHLWEWGYWWELEHPEAGKRVLPGLPVKFSA